MSLCTGVEIVVHPCYFFMTKALISEYLYILFKVHRTLLLAEVVS